MTPDAQRGILKLDTDGCLSWHYWRQTWHRRILFRVEEDRIIHRCPATKAEIEVGKVVRVGKEVLIAIFFL